MSQPIDRRAFHAKMAATSGAIATATAIGSNLIGTNVAAQDAPAKAKGDKIRLGFIGVANRGGQLLDAYLEHADAEIVALCDIDSVALDRALDKVTKSRSKPESYPDFRAILDRKDIDAVVIATPDHWHAIQTILACEAGKDVYIEKPLSITVREGRRMVIAARKHNRIVQVGTHRRSSSIYHKLVPRCLSGEFGKLTVGRAYRASNMAPEGIGKVAAMPPPETLDWNMWLGPRPERPYQSNITPYKFRWWGDYSSQMANWGVHYLDVMRWCFGEEAPSSVCAMGGRFAIDDDRTVPDTMEVTFQFPSGRLAIFGQYEASGSPVLPVGDVELRGTLGTIYAGERDFQVIPEKDGQFQNAGPRGKPEKITTTESNHTLTVAHTRNFLDCIVSRQLPNADIEIGHRSTTMALLANISLATGLRLEWDSQAENITNSQQADSMLDYEYREPWRKYQ